MKARALSAALAALAAAVPAVLPGAAAAQAPAQTAPAVQTAPVINKVVLRINDRIATLYEYQSRYQRMEGELLAADLPLADRREIAQRLPERVFGDLYQELLLLSRADQLGVVFTEEEIEERLAAMRERSGFADQRELEAALAQSGMSLRDFREEVEKNMRIEEVVVREVRSQLGAEDEELARRYYQDHPERFTAPTTLHVREIIVLEAEGQTAEQRAELAAAIRRDVAAGRALAEIAATYRDRGLTSDVIDHGWVAPGDLAPELEQAIWELPAGSFSDPVESRGGLHLLEIVERREAGLRPYAEIADQVRNAALQVAFTEQMATYLDRLEEQAYIQLDPPAGAEGFRSAAPAEAVEAVESVETPEGAAESAAEEAAADPLPAPDEVTTAPPQEATPPGDGE